MLMHLSPVGFEEGKPPPPHLFKRIVNSTNPQ